MFQRLLALSAVAVCWQLSAASWIPLTDGLPVNQGIASLAANSNTVAFATASGGIFICQNPDLAFSESVARMAGDPPTAKRVFLERGLVLAAPELKENRSPLFYSSDLGLSWQSVEGLPAGTEVGSVVSHGEYIVVTIPPAIYRARNVAGPWEEVTRLPCSFLAASGDYLFPMFSFLECYVIGKDNVPRLTGLATHPASQQAVIFKGRLFTGVRMHTPAVNPAYMAWLDLQSLEWKTSSHVGLPAAVYSSLAADADALFAASSTSVMTTSDGLNWAPLDVPAPPAGLSHLAVTGGKRLLAASGRANAQTPSLFYLPLDQATIRSTPPAFTGLERRNIEVLEKENVRIQPQVEGTPPFVFRWERNQGDGTYTPIPGATNDHLFLAGVTKANSGIYRLSASNVLGSASVDTRLHVSSKKLGGYLPNPSFVTTDVGFIQKLMVNPDGKFYAIGAFFDLGYRTNRLGTSYDSGVARFLPDGTRDTTFYCTNYALGSVTEILAQPDGKLLLAGAMYLPPGRNRFIGRVDSMGRPEMSFVPPVTSGTVSKIGLFADESILVGGRMILAGRGTQEFYLIRLNPDGSFRSEFPAVGGGPNAAVETLLRLDDGKWLVGGMFNSYSGVPVPRLVRVLADGSLDRTFSAPTNMTLSASLVALQKDGKILVGVSDLPAGPQPSPGVCIVRLNPDGTIDNSFTSACTSGGAILALAVGEDGWIYVAGSFTKAGGTPRNSVARFHPDGRVDEAFDVKGAARYNSALAFTPEGHLLVAGGIADPDFPKNRILAVYTHLSSPARLATRISGTPGQLELLLEGSAGDSYRIQQSSDLQNWSDHSVLKLEGTQGRITVDSTKPRLWLRAISD